MSEDKIHILQRQIIDIIKDQTELEKKLEVKYENETGHALYHKEKLGPRIEKLEKKLSIYYKRDVDLQIQLDDLKDFETELSELKKQFIEKNRGINSNTVNDNAKLRERINVDIKKHDKDVVELRGEIKSLKEQYSTLEDDVIRDLDNKDNRFIDEIKSLKEQIPKLPYYLRVAEFMDFQEHYDNLQEVLQGLLILQANNSMSISKYHKKIKKLQDKLGGEKTVASGVGVGIASQYPNKEPTTDSKPPRCNKCGYYGECDHQGAYKKDGKWCYEGSEPPRIICKEGVCVYGEPVENCERYNCKCYNYEVKHKNPSEQDLPPNMKKDFERMQKEHDSRTFVRTFDSFYEKEPADDLEEHLDKILYPYTDKHIVVEKQDLEKWIWDLKHEISRASIIQKIEKYLREDKE